MKELLEKLIKIENSISKQPLFPSQISDEVLASREYADEIRRHNDTRLRASLQLVGLLPEIIEEIGKEVEDV